jgi:hypothetical protein
MTTTPVNQRLFGKTQIDSLSMAQSSWYLAGTKITATPTQLNNITSSVDYVAIYNDTGGALSIGMLLHISGYDDTSGFYKVEKADADASKPAQLIATDTTANGKTTTAATTYAGATLNTALATLGDPIYLSATPGTYTLTAPTAANAMVQIVGRVTLVNASGTVSLELRFPEVTKIASNELQALSVGTAALAATGVTSAKINNDVATGMAGSGLIASSGTLNISNMGAIAVGGVNFTAKATCTSITVGTAVYTATYVGAHDGTWAIGANANESAVNLAAAINADTRNGGTTYYTALNVTDAVFIFSNTSAAGVAITVQGTATQPSTVQTQVGTGLAAIPVKTTLVKHVVTALDLLPASFSIPLPFAPTTFMFQVMTTAGVIKTAITDQFTIGTTPNRIVVTSASTGHPIAGDVIVIYATE